MYVITYHEEIRIEYVSAGAFDASNDFSVRFASGGQGAVLQRDADLLHLWTVFQRAQVGAKKTEAQAALTAEISKRSKVDREVREATRELLSQPAILSMLYVRIPLLFKTMIYIYPPHSFKFFSLLLAANAAVV